MLNKTSCPYPNNLSPLSNLGFILAIDKLPDVTFFAQTVEIPTMQLPSAELNTPFSRINYAGDVIAFAPFTFTFLVDNDMCNYTSVYSWIKGLGFPTSYEEYKDLIRNSNKNGSEANKNFSDGSLTVLNNFNNPIREFRFIDMHPTALTLNQPFSTIEQDVVYLTGTVTFNYNYFELK